MSNRFIITFAKEGYIKYISHLDTVRLFERGFKRGNIKLQYSQGFNPHPKMVFAQPLSLGYLAENEKLEIETKYDYKPNEIKSILEEIMPIGLIIKSVESNNNKGKTLASLTEAAVYTIDFGEEFKKLFSEENELERICSSFVLRDEIIVTKIQKKTSKLKEINIKPMIIELVSEGNQKIKTTVAQGSEANLSPEQLIKALLEYANIDYPRNQIEITRNKIIQREQ